MIVLLSVSVLLQIVGIILMVLSCSHRTKNYPYNTFWNPKYFKPWWMHRDWFTPKGFKLIGYGSSMVVLGGILGVIYWTPLCLGSLFS